AQDRKDNYDQDFDFMTYQKNGQRIIKNNRVITKASALLTQKQLRDKGMKVINPLRLLPVIKEMEKGKSLDQIRKQLKLSNSVFSKLKSDLNMFQIYESTVQFDEYIESPEISFKEYYFKLKSLAYQKKFYNQPRQQYYG